MNQRIGSGEETFGNVNLCNVYGSTRVGAPIDGGSVAAGNTGQGS